MGNYLVAVAHWAARDSSELQQEYRSHSNYSSQYRGHCIHYLVVAMACYFGKQLKAVADACYYYKGDDSGGNNIGWDEPPGNALEK